MNAHAHRTECRENQWKELCVDDVVTCWGTKGVVVDLRFLSIVRELEPAIPGGGCGRLIEAAAVRSRYVVVEGRRYYGLCSRRVQAYCSRNP